MFAENKPDPKALSSMFQLMLKSQGYNDNYDTLGERYSYNTIGINFASAAASPLGHYKFHSGPSGDRNGCGLCYVQLEQMLRGYRQINFFRSEESGSWSQATAPLHSLNALTLRPRCATP
jgi:hypothetical protein